MLMMVNASPATEDAPETACSLAFAARVRGVKLGHAKKHVESGLEVRSLRGEISALEDQVILSWNQTVTLVTLCEPHSRLRIKASSDRS